MNSELSQRASNDLERVVAWWRRELGSNPPHLQAELKDSLRLLERFPNAGVEYARTRHHVIYRILLRESQYHVYYRLHPDLIYVVTIWATARERGPRFGPTS